MTPQTTTPSLLTADLCSNDSGSTDKNTTGAVRLSATATDRGLLRMVVVVV